MKLPEFTYHVTVFWRDGAIMSHEHDVTDRDAAFDAAAHIIDNNYGTVGVLRIERNVDTQVPLSVSDVTDEFYAERVPDVDPVDGADGPECDTAYDEWKEA